MLLAQGHPAELKDNDDASLLRAYAESGSQHAFAALVEKHIHLVHSCALRQCGNDPHLAHDVTQVVFMALAKKSRRLAPDVVLAGWLVRAAHFTAASMRRAERRRRGREVRAAMLRDRETAMQSKPEEQSTSSDVLWQRVGPLLDGLLARLPAAGRDVLVLRFLEGRPYAAIGQRLGISEESARKRAQRALASLRGALARQGIITCEDALEAALAGAIALPAPAALAKAVAAGIGTAHHHELILKGALKLMAWSKAKIAAATIAAAVLVGGGGVVGNRLMHSGATRVVELPAGDQSAPAPVRQVPSASPTVIRGVVRDPAGRPVAGAKVLAAFNQMQFLELSADPQMGPPSAPKAVTGADGVFEISVPFMPVGAVVLGPDGAAEAPSRALSGTPELTVQNYGRIEGTLRFDHKPIRPGSQLLLSTAMLAGHGAQFQMRGRTDASGHFAIERIPPGQYALFISGEDQDGQIRILPGTSARVDIDRPTGRTISGILDGITSRSQVTFLLNPSGPGPATQPAGTFVLSSWQFDGETDAAGHFKIEHAPLGPAHLAAVNIPGKFGTFEKELRIPSPPNEQPYSPFDAGTIKFKSYR